MPKQETERLEHRRIEYLHQRLEWREQAWLRSRGWTYTSSTPGCYWMWMKEWDGKTFLVSQDTAARIQGYWDADADAEAHPEEYED